VSRRSGLAATAKARTASIDELRGMLSTLGEAAPKDLGDQLAAQTAELAGLQAQLGATDTQIAQIQASVRAQLDASQPMLDRARGRLPNADLRLARLEDPLPDGPFDLVVSVLAVHHLDGPEKRDLFERLARVIVPEGRFVLGDVVVPERPEDAVVEIDWVEDLPSSVPEQLGWLDEAGFDAEASSVRPDLAVFVARRRPR